MTTPPLPRSRSYRLKLDRAKAHFEALKRDVDAFLGEPHPYRASIKFDAQTSEYRLIGHVDREAPPELGPIIGDFLFNLRSALDNLAYDLVKSGGGVQSDRTAFPIFNDCALFHARTKKGAPTPRSGLYKMIGMGQPAQDAIETLQPYHGRNGPPDRDPLWLLHELNNVDKHRTLHVVAACIKALRFGGLQPLAVVADAWTWGLGPFVEGQVLARMKVRARFPELSLGDPQAYFNGEGTFDVAFADEPDPVSLTGRLAAIGEYTESVILTLEPLL